MLEDVNRCEDLTRVFTWCLAVAVNAGESKNAVEGLIALSREDDCGSKAPNISREVNQEMELGFAD